MTRTIPGLLLAFGWLLLLLYGSYLLFWGVVVLIGIIGGREYIRMVLPDISGGSDRTVISIIIAIPILTTAFAVQPAFRLSPGVFLAFSALVIFTMYSYSRFENPYIILKKGVLGIVFIGFLASHLVMIRSLTDGACWLIILTAITAGSDTGAYWIGRRFGKRRLCPSISPNKTVEGALGGVGGAIIAALVMYFLVDIQSSVLTILLLAVFLSIAGMLGDLLESIIKRGTGAKDSGTLLGGHGGVLDRIDSLLLAAPFLYYFLFYQHF
ncbi:MAG: phosphatidate cytidylyltransferase [Desulfocapsaceae bacterium]|jgi:phosphatidate cytidylyltransferase|nr:phosphatidate cytidylyltransferase [Desulfocapsaceae bacterium]